MNSTNLTARLAASLVAGGIGLVMAPVAAAEPDDASAPAPVEPGPIQVAEQNADDADPAAVAACSQFADALDATSVYYGEFADSLESYQDPNFSDPEIRSSNTVGRTALRQAAGVSLSAANTPGLPPDIASPMRSWSVGATKLLIKMGLRGSGETLDTTANEMNEHAVSVQQACAAAGTHA